MVLVASRKVFVLRSLMLSYMAESVFARFASGCRFIFLSTATSFPFVTVNPSLWIADVSCTQGD